MKINYNNTLIGGFNDLGQPKILALDESLFVHNEAGEQLWVLGGIEIKYLKYRLEITKKRNAATLEKFVNEKFYEGMHFTHDVWAVYSFLNNNINYTHESHHHGVGNFGFGFNSTAHIEN